MGGCNSEARCEEVLYSRAFLGDDAEGGPRENDGLSSAWPFANARAPIRISSMLHLIVFGLVFLDICPPLQLLEFGTGTCEGSTPQTRLCMRPLGPMDKSSAHGAGDCRLESCRGHAAPALVLVRRRANAPQGPACLLTRASRPAVRLFFAELRAPPEAYVCHSAPRGGAPAQRTRHRPTELEAVGSSPTGAMQLLR